MDSIFFPENRSRKFKRPVVTLGFFDGVHLGHQNVLGETTRRAAEAGDESVAITFNEHPVTAITGREVQVLTSLDYRLILLKRRGINCAAVLRFDSDLARLTAEEFAREYIAGRLHASFVVLGFDCRFGADRGGDGRMLEELGPDLGFGVHVCPPVRIKGEIVSSTLLRRLVQEGDLTQAAEMLGRPVSLHGTVVKGHRRGRKLGYPTANLDIRGVVRPPDGVYVGLTTLDSLSYKALISIGARPTFSSENAPRTRSRYLRPSKADSAGSVVEVHLLDFKGNLYGRDMEISFLHHLREQRRFDSVEALEASLKADEADARRLMS
ncbi:MAG TPA: riboflavin biosynthesis protein RibF [Candidatus Brocadiia bacterium]|nr:riboflavin biosynthesis protein RibF [Candidatus Brocadiia bacterium]